MKEKLIDSLARFLIIGCVFLIGTALEAENTELSDLKARAEKGDAEAQVNLGVMYHNGQGVLAISFGHIRG